jgi:hypothetical protein
LVIINLKKQKAPKNGAPDRKEIIFIDFASNILQGDGQ